jgi:carbonic anhydrase
MDYPKGLKENLLDLFLEKVVEVAEEGLQNDREIYEMNDREIYEMNDREIYEMNDREIYG